MREKPDFKKYFFYVFLIKGLVFLLFAFLFNKGADEKDNVHFIFTYSKDYASYIEPAVNFVDKGVSYEDSDGKKLYAHKMPGMTPIFAPLYYVFGLEWGLTFLALVQYLLDALSCVLLGYIALKLFNNLKAFYITFFIYSLSTIVSVSTHFAVSELLCTCFSIFAFYYSLKAEKKLDFFLAGFFATWSVFFRPTSILLFLILPLIIILSKKEKLNIANLKLKRTALILFSIPFLFFETLWIVRNYSLMNRFIPAEISQENFGTPAMKSVFSVILAIGGDLQSWNPDSEMRWFNEPGSIDYDANYAKSFPFPSYVSKGGITRAKLLSLREKYYAYTDTSISKPEKVALEKKINAECKLLISEFKTNAPFYYYIVSPLRNLKTFIFIKRPYGFSFRNNGLLEKLVRAWHFGWYYIVLILFLLSLLLLFTNFNSLIWTTVGLILLHIALYGLILRYSENRYLVPVYPYMTLIATASVIQLASLILKTFNTAINKLAKKPFINAI